MTATYTPISVFDMLEIGVGPSSSHTLGPWRAAGAFVDVLASRVELDEVSRVTVDLFGSLAKTGRGHGTGVALMMGLSGEDPVTCDVDRIQSLGPEVADSGSLRLSRRVVVPFDRDRDLRFVASDDDGLIDLGMEDPHPNAMRFTAHLRDGGVVTHVAFSVGGGFVEHADDGYAPLPTGRADVRLDHPIETAADLQAWTDSIGGSIADVVRTNERAWRDDEQIDADMLRVRETMLACIVRGCRRRGVLPGGLDVSRRAPDLHDELVAPVLGTDVEGPSSLDEVNALDPAAWFDLIRRAPCGFDDTVAWVSCYALAVNEENAAFGRVVTAPTNGAAGVIPAVLIHHLATLEDGTASQHDIDREAIRFLLVAGEIAAIFKKGSTISAAMGGCQAEIGVSSAMAAAALTECRGGSVAQALMAAEIAMEHHLGLTCDPIGGLVQVPCIERNAIGAMKAISASRLARISDPTRARVSLDTVIETMWATALDMSEKYKETAEGGLAVRIPVNLVEC